MMRCEENNVCPHERPRFSMVRLCEGRSIMLTPRCSVFIDPDHAERTFGIISRFEEEFVKIEWSGILVTLYKTGSMLFYHLSDRDSAESYATEILAELGLVSGGCRGRGLLAAGDLL